MLKETSSISSSAILNSTKIKGANGICFSIFCSLSGHAAQRAEVNELHVHNDWATGASFHSIIMARSIG
jgi:hypothetical protein